MRRFYVNRLIDQTGVSGTGKILEGVELESGRVVVEWRKPNTTLGIYSSIEEFRKIHIDCHPDCNELIFFDNKTEWHCFACGASGMDGNFCQLCGSPETAYHPAFEGFEPNERHSLQKELDALNVKTMHVLSNDERKRKREIMIRLTSGNL